MYEVWLTLNILWELATDHWLWVAAVALLWLALAAAALLCRARWRPALTPALAVGAIVAVASFLMVPAMTKSALSELGYWVDWLNLLAIAAAIGVIAVALGWPLLGLLKGRRP